jgi:hypothetical protein
VAVISTSCGGSNQRSSPCTQATAHPAMRDVRETASGRRATTQGARGTT